MLQHGGRGFDQDIEHFNGDTDVQYYLLQEVVGKFYRRRCESYAVQGQRNTLDDHAERSGKVRRVGGRAVVEVNLSFNNK